MPTCGTRLILQQQQVLHCTVAVLHHILTETSFLSDNTVNKKRHRQASVRSPWWHNGQRTIRKLLATYFAQWVAQPAFDGDQQEFCVRLQTQTHVISLIHAQGALTWVKEWRGWAVIMINIFQKVIRLKNMETRAGTIVQNVMIPVPIPLPPLRYWFLNYTFYL